jgi:hypothetical protein
MGFFHHSLSLFFYPKSLLHPKWNIDDSPFAMLTKSNNKIHHNFFIICDQRQHIILLHYCALIFKFHTVKIGFK